jgi:integrase
MSVFKRPGSPYYQFEFKFKNRRYRGSTEKASKRDAEAVERLRKQEAEADMAAGRTPGAMSFGDACARYIFEKGQHGPRPDQVEWSMAWLMATIGEETLLRNISNATVAHVVAKRRGEVVENVARDTKRSRRRRAPAGPPKLVSAATVNRSVTEPLRKVLHRARDTWAEQVQIIRWRDHMLKEASERVRELSIDEEARLFAALAEHHHPIILYKLRTGCRIMECVDLDYEAIDWGNRRIAVLGKGDDLSVIPMTASVRDLLWSQRDDHTGRVFLQPSGKPFTYSGVDSAFGRALAKAGITNLHLHDIRHTRATRLLRETGNLKLVQKALRHKNIETTARYAHVLDEDLRSGLEAAEAAETRARVPTNVPTIANAGTKTKDGTGG